MAAKKRKAAKTKATPERPTRKRDPGRRWSPAEFLDVLRETGTVVGAAKTLNINKGTVYKEMAADPEFREACDVARGYVVNDIEDDFAVKAREGWDEITEVYTANAAGEQVLAERRVTRKWSPTPGIFLAKGARPGKYSERVVAERLLRDAGGDARSVAARLREIAKEMDGSVPSEPEAEAD